MTTLSAHTEPPTVKYIVPKSRSRPPPKPPKPEPPVLWAAPGPSVNDLLDDDGDEEDVHVQAPVPEPQQEELPPPPSPPMFAEIEVNRPRVRRPARAKKTKKVKPKVEPPQMPVITPLVLPSPISQTPQAKVSRIVIHKPVVEPKVVPVDIRPPPAPPKPAPKRVPLPVPPPKETTAPRPPPPKPLSAPFAPAPLPRPARKPQAPPTPVMLASETGSPVVVKVEAVLEQETTTVREPNDTPALPAFLSGEVDERAAAIIVAALINLLDVGLWMEKVEACKGLLFLFRTFKDDFLDPMEVLIRPQLEHLEDDAWQVRGQICANLAQYGIVNNQILGHLIKLLADKVEFVRTAALKSLSVFGVQNKLHLEDAMRQCGILPRREGDMYMNCLDSMISEEEARRNAARNASTTLTTKWLSVTREGHKRAPAGRLRRRRNSYFEHLAGRFFPPDARVSANGAPRYNFDAAEQLSYTDWDEGVPKGWDTLPGDKAWSHRRHVHHATATSDSFGAALITSARAAEPPEEGPSAHDRTRSRAKMMRIAARTMRPMTAGALFAGGDRALAASVTQPALKLIRGTKRPFTAPATSGREKVDPKQASRGWAETLRPTLPPVDGDIHDRPFRA
ncbi:hypothetical protein HKX48_003636 [Thoreauomyces humboldtii]|nr:hypothetical protein HKX48_003636 [Thoreauomyces humboldtii]